MRYFLLFCLFIFRLNASVNEVKTYMGFVSIDQNQGHYSGILCKNSSEDETLSIEIGLKNVNIEDMNYKQKETFISLERELDIDKFLRFSYLNIDNDIYGGNLYELAVSKEFDSGIEFDIGIGFLNYNVNDVYQFNLRLKDFIFDSSFYYKTKYILNFVNSDEDRYYNALDLEIGFIEGKFQAMVSSFIGEKRYALQDEDCFSWNMGNIHKYGGRTSFIYQLTLDKLVKLDYLYSKMEQQNKKLQDLDVLNLVFSYRF